MIAPANTQPISIDLDMARDFLHLLDPDGVFTFQIFRDHKRATAFATVLHGSFDEHSKALIAANRSGAGIFVMVNRGDGITHKDNKTCRTKASVIAVRAAFLDLDGASPEPLLHVIPKPAILVESSPDRYHAYWPLADCELAQFEDIQLKLAVKFSGDKSVKDLPRVMRVPGFIHQKDKPFQTRLITLEDLS